MDFFDRILTLHIGSLIVNDLVSVSDFWFFLRNANFTRNASRDTDVPVLVHIHARYVSLLELILHQGIREVVLDEGHDGPPQRPRPVHPVKALRHQLVHHGPGHLEANALLGHSPGGLVQEQVGDLGDLLLLQEPEDDDLVKPVQELRLEVGTELLQDEAPDLVVLGLLRGLGRESEPELGSSLGNDVGAQVRGQDENTVLEAHGPALGVGQDAVLDDLQKDVEDVRVSLLDLVQKDEAVRLPPDGLRQLSALAVTDVARGRAHELGHCVLLHILTHVQPDHGVLAAEGLKGEALRELGLAHSSWAGEEHRGDGAVGVLEANRGPLHRLGDGLHGFLLANDPLGEGVLELQHPGLVGVLKLPEGDSGPLGDDLLDGIAVHHGEEPVVLLVARVHHEGLELRLPLLQEGGLLEGLALDAGVLGLGDLLVLLPERVVLLGLVVVLGPPLVKGSDAGPAPGLVDQVNGLVGQVPVSDVPGGEGDRGLDGLVGEDALVVPLVPLLESLDDLVGVLLGGLVHRDGLEPPLEGGVPLDVLPVLVEGGRADALEVAPGQGRLHQVGDVEAAPAPPAAADGPGSHKGVDLVDQEDDLSGLGDLLQELGDPVLELPPLLGPGHQQAHVQGHDLLVLEELRELLPENPDVVDDALGEALGDGGLPHPRLPEQDGVVLPPPRQDLHHAQDLLVPADDRVEVAVPRLLAEVAAELLQDGLLLLLALAPGALGHGLLPALARGLAVQLLDGLADHGLGLHAELPDHHVDRGVLRGHEGHGDVLRGHEVVPHLLGLLQGEVKDLLGAQGEGDVG
mmetsp:Transcript_12109/g.33550  ORF Transcript_12109/g.33550 Transcript_12109/m.33550 type:complete len:800 (+) Transcript_12109:33-2432(+)